MSDVDRLIDLQIAVENMPTKLPADDDRLDCEAGCAHFTGGDVRHDPGCKHYPDSINKMLDDARAANATITAASAALREELEAARAKIETLEQEASARDPEITKLYEELGAAQEREAAMVGLLRELSLEVKHSGNGWCRLAGPDLRPDQATALAAQLTAAIKPEGER